MNPWHFILAAYAVSAILVVVEIVAVRMRRRAAESLVRFDDDASGEPRATVPTR
jgi:hypothetical protein